MIALSLTEIAAVTGGTIVGGDSTRQVVVDGPVVTDSREAAAGSLYVARVGELADGHDFVEGAARRGAVAALTTRPVAGLPCVVVPDTQAAFVALARHLVDTVPGLTVVGVTGSSGKTSTKDLLGSVLAHAGETVAPVGSYNSEVGVPLTVCRLTSSTRFLVVEMGARGIGHVAYLAQVAPPHIGVVLNVGVAHVGEFGSREAIARAKAELVEALAPEGLAILNADDPAVRAMADRTRARVLLVGEAADATIRASGIELDDAGCPHFTVTTPQGARDLHLGLVGQHHVGNALAALAVALECGMELEDAAVALEAARPVSRWRMEVVERADGVTLVNDAYNANPDSMAAALAALERIGRDRRTWAVLGSMLELGEDSEDLHAQVGVLAVERGVDELVVVGTVAAPMAAAAQAAAASGAAGNGIRVRAVPDADAAEALLRAELVPSDVVLFKSSRDAGLRLLGDKMAMSSEELP